MISTLFLDVSVSLSLSLPRSLCMFRCLDMHAAAVEKRIKIRKNESELTYTIKPSARY